jgi:hypothetical protein
VLSFSRPAGFLRVVCLRAGVGAAVVVLGTRLSRRDFVVGGGAREDSEIPMSSGTMSSDSDSEASSVSDITRGEPTNGASRLFVSDVAIGGTLRSKPFVYSFSPR